MSRHDPLPRPLTKQEKVEEIDISREWQELKTLEKDILELEKKIEGYLREIK